MITYNAEGQPAGEIADGAPVPLGRWVQGPGGQMVQGNGQVPAQVLTTAGDPYNYTAPQYGAPQYGGIGDLVTPPPTSGPGGGTPPPGGTTPAPTPPPATPKPTFSQLLAQYKAEHPGLPMPTGDEFNAWTGAKGLSWEDDPPGTPNVYSNPPPPGGTNTNTNPNGAANNFNQSQTAQQGGAYETTGNTANTQHTNTGATTAGTQNVTNQQATTNQQNTTGVQDTTQSQTGGTTQNTTQQQQGATTGTSTGTTSNTTSGTATTKVDDALGFGALLQGQKSGALTSDTARTGFLSDLVTTGGSAFAPQVDAAVRGAMSGPGLNGAGESARARASGYAAANIARNNTDQRLQGAAQLAGPTAVTSLAGAANPYLGSTVSQTGTNVGTSTGTTTGTSIGSATGTNNSTNFSDLVGQVKNQQASIGSGTSTGVQDTTNNQTQTGFQDLVSSSTEGTKGKATGSSAQQAAGLIPQAQQVATGGGGCIICTAGLHHGLWKHKRLLRLAVRHKTQMAYSRFRHAIAGYFFLFTPIARFCLSHRLASQVSLPIARAVVYEEVRIAGRGVPFKVVPWALHWTWHGVCSIAGRFTKVSDLRDPVLVATAQKHQVFFPLAK